MKTHEIFSAAEFVKPQKQYRNAIRLNSWYGGETLDACVRFLPLFPEDPQLVTVEYKVYMPPITIDDKNGRKWRDKLYWFMPIDNEDIDDPDALRNAEKLERLSSYGNGLDVTVAVSAPAQVIHYKHNGIEDESLGGQVVICRFGEVLRDILHTHIMKDDPLLLDIYQGSDVHILIDESTDYKTSVSFSDTKPLMIDGKPASEKSYADMLRREEVLDRLRKCILPKEKWLIHNAEAQYYFDKRFGYTNTRRSLFASPSKLDDGDSLK